MTNVLTKFHSSSLCVCASYNNFLQCPKLLYKQTICSFCLNHQKVFYLKNKRMVCIPLVSTVAVLLLARVKAHEDSNCSFPVPSIRWSSPVPERNSDGLFTTLKDKCVGGDAALLTTGLRLTYEIKKYNLIESYWIYYNSSVPAPSNCSLSDVERVDYSFVQPEHGGKYCHCFEVFFEWNCSQANCTK